MKKQITVSLFLLLFVLAPAADILAHKTTAAVVQGTWEALGTLKAGRMGDHDVMNLPDPHMHYKQLKFKVTDAPLNIKKMVITYDDGQTQTVGNRYEIKKGGESNTIDLMAGTHKLKSVELWYDTQGLIKGKAHVTLYGMK